MVSKKGSRLVSMVSSAAAPSQSGATTLSANKSSILQSAFSPSEYQLALFASVIQGLDAHHLRIHNVGTGRLQCDHAVNPRESITCLDWGYYGDAKGREQHQKKKRKRSSGVNGAVVDEVEDVVVAFGTSTSEIRMYSPAEDKITGILTGGHERGIRDFKFTHQKPGEGWSIGGDGKLVQWDLRKGRSIRVISLPSTSVSTLARPVPSNPPVLCASQTPYIIDLEKGSEASFSAMRNAVHTLISSSSDLANLTEEFIAADSDRYINVFDAQKQKLVGSFVAENEVDSAVFYQASSTGKKEARVALFQKQVLAAVTRDGTIELFSGPFLQFKEQSASGAATRSNKKSLTRRANAVIKIIRPDKSRTPVPVISVSFQGPDLVVAWVEGGVSLAFDRIRWQSKDSEDLMLQGEVEIVKARSAPIAGNTNGVKDLGKSHVDETHAVVKQGGMDEGLPGNMDVDAASQSSDASDNEEAPSDNENEPETKQLTKKPDTDVEMADAQSDTAEPSFGELLRAHGTSEPIDVAAALDEDDTANQAMVPSKSRHAVATLPSGLSMSTVLTQSLKTNDTTLLESCFHTTDLAIVRSTIQRLDSSLAATLLSKLAERISTRPGRYGHLLVWVQWTCVAHGGAIAGRPEILREMSSLFKVMDQRSKTLNSLLLLKGKLDMLDAQLGLRQSLRRGAGGMDSDDEEGVIYVEGEEDLEESDADVDEEATPAKKTGRDELLGFDGEEEDGEEDDEHMPLTVNGLSDNEESDDEEDADMLDDEAEVSGEEGENVSEDEDEEDEEEEGSMLDFIADSDEEEDESDLELSTMAPNVGKKGKTQGKGRKAGKR